MNTSPHKYTFLSKLTIFSALVLLIAVIGIPTFDNMNSNNNTTQNVLPYDLRINDDVILKCFNHSNENLNLDLTLKSSAGKEKHASLQLATNDYTSSKIFSLFNLERNGNKKDAGTITYTEVPSSDSQVQVSCELVNIKYDNN